MSRPPRIVVIGGGTGSFTVLSALKAHTPNLTAIVNMVDDGGSTGVLRDELGALPPGDVRQCLVALSDAPVTMRELFSYRFAEGSLKGHSFGNLFLTALEKSTGSFGEAVKTAGQVLNITGQVLPVTLADTKLIMTRPGGEEVTGQHAVELADFEVTREPALHLEPAASLNPEAAAAIMAADLVLIAPGNLYASLAPALLVEGMPAALQATKAPVVYACNLVTKPGQTDGFGIHDYAREIERFIGTGTLDGVIYNNRKPSDELLARYAEDGEYWVGRGSRRSKGARYACYGTSLVSATFPAPQAGDTLIRRTYIRHDGAKLSKLVLQLVDELK